MTRPCDTCGASAARVDGVRCMDGRDAWLCDECRHNYADRFPGMVIGFIAAISALIVVRYAWAIGRVVWEWMTP